MERISRDELYSQIAQLVSKRGTCPKLQVGAVFTLDGRIVCTGYNGAPSGMQHCTEVGCQEDSDHHCTTALHAEASAISYAARKGIALEGSTCYLTVDPCHSCAKLLINAGVKRVVILSEYTGSHNGYITLVYAGVEVVR